MKKQIFLNGIPVKIQKIHDNLYAITMPLANKPDEVRPLGNLYFKLTTKCHGLHTWETSEQIPESFQLTRTRTLLFDHKTCKQTIPIYCKVEKKEITT